MLEYYKLHVNIKKYLPAQVVRFTVYMEIHRHTGGGRYPVIYNWILDQVRNDVRHFHVSLSPFQGMTVSWLKNPG